MISMLFIFLSKEWAFFFLLPYEVKTFTSWAPKKHEMGMGWIPAFLPRAYQENISFNFTYVALND